MSALFAKVRVGSLRFRVTSWYVGLMACALLMFGLSVYFGLARYLESTLQQSLEQEAASIGPNFLELDKQKGDQFVIGEVSESYAPEISGRFIRITRQDGSVLYRSGDLHAADARDADIPSATIPALSSVPAMSTGVFRRIAIPGAAAMEIYAQPYATRDGLHFLVETGTSRQPLDRILRSLLLTLLLPTPLILIVAALGGYLLMSQPLKPMVALTEQAERIGAENFSERLPVIPTGDELERLSLSLNRMLARLEEAINHIHRFSGDVSHELRTPLTILRGELEHLVQIPMLEAGMMDAVGSALEEIERMSKIVESLLAIARLDFGDAGMERGCVDLRALACTTAEQMHVLAEEKSITVVCADGLPVQVFGDEARLKQVVVNLLDNAVKYTQDQGRIEVRAWAHGQVGMLQVADDGIGIPPDALPHVFERFYRADKARSRASGGTGLGLSIVKAIVSAHGGLVSVESTVGAGTKVTVELPLYESVHGPGSRNGAGGFAAKSVEAGPQRRMAVLQEASQVEKDMAGVPALSSVQRN